MNISGQKIERSALIRIQRNEGRRETEMKTRGRQRRILVSRRQRVCGRREVEEEGRVERR